MKKASPQPQIIPNIQNIPDLVLFKDTDKSRYLAKLKSKKEIKIVYFGTPEFSAFILEELIKFCDSSVGSSFHTLDDRTIDVNFSIQAVVTRPDQPVGRHQEMRQSPVAMVAQRYGIPTLKPAKLDEDFQTKSQVLPINSHLPACPAGGSILNCQLFIVASYGKIIPQDLLDIPKLGALNVHPSLLPKYRGASPIITPLLNGDKKTGITIMLMDAQMDHGPILATKKVSISSLDNNQTLSNKLYQESALLLIDTLIKFVDGNIKPTPQNHNQATFTKIIKKDDGYFDIDNPPSPETLDRKIRAYYPWPGVWTNWNGKIVKFLPARNALPEAAASLQAGSHSAVGGPEYLIQMEGKKPVSVKDFLNGYPNFPLGKLFSK